ncbi:MAG: flagellar biosynthetic protein FliO [Deltaproteobacteria bacterium]|nr:flagellar biosynthetic protein FliO [Deltaproteobacteria bacterium]
MTESGFWMAGLKTLAMLCVVLGLLILVLLIMRRFLYQRQGCGPGKIIKVISTRHVSPKGRISLIDVAGERFLIGITPETITMLGKVHGNGMLSEVHEGEVLGRGKGFFERLLNMRLDNGSGSRSS